MSLSSTLSATRSATGQRAVRAATAVAVAIALLVPVAVLFAQVWSSTGDKLSFAADERRGVAYLGPLTRLLSVTTDAQSRAVAGNPVDPAAVRTAIADVDEIDGRLGGQLRTTDRWTTIRGIVRERTSRKWTQPAEAYTQYSDLVTQLMELNRKVADASRLVLDSELDAYYVMNAAVLRIPEILVDSGRYTDLSVLNAASGLADSGSAAQLTAARNRVATNATDLSDGLVKAFGDTTSPTLGPGLTRPLDDFRTAVDAVAPSNSLLAPAPERSLNDLGSDQDGLQRAALTLHQAALGELDQLLSDREDGTGRVRLIAIGAMVLGLLLTGLAASALRPSWGGAGDEPDPADETEANAAGPPRPTRSAFDPPPRRRGRPPAPDQPLSDQPLSDQPLSDQPLSDQPAPDRPLSDQPAPDRPAPGLVGAAGPEQRGGARAPR